MNIAFQRLLTAVQHPETMTALSAAEWDGLLRHSRSASLLSRLALDVQAIQGWDALPARVRQHMRGACFVAERQIRAVRWEVHKVHQALGDLGIPIVLLKGSAYVMAELPPARGRLFGDIDLLVPREHIGDVELLLRLHGWHGTQHDAYDQRYYREWMHEIPPVTHITRGSTLDVHHNILPLTARLKPQAKDLFTSLRPIPGYSNLYRLGDADLILHSATHLFHEGEWAHGLRDLVDLDALLRHFASQPDFMSNLYRRAITLDLTQPLHHALHCTRALLNTPLNELGVEPDKNTPGNKLVQQLFMHGFASAHPDLSKPGARIALLALYIRSHGLRMPMHQLLPHLWHKAMSHPKVTKD
jgi:hypothetical protein